MAIDHFTEKDLSVSASKEDLMELVEHIESGNWGKKWSDIAYTIRCCYDDDFRRGIERE